MTKEEKDTSQNGFDNVAFQPASDDVKSDGTVHPVDTNDSSEQEKNCDATPKIDTRFGYGSCKPSFLQRINRLWVLEIWLFLFCFLEGFAINGIANAGLPGIERQFKLTSSKSSLIPASQDIGALILVLFISFIGGRYNKIRIIAVGSLLMAVGSFIFTIPHIASTYDYLAWWDAESLGVSPDSKLCATVRFQFGSGVQEGGGPGDTCQGSVPGAPPCDTSGEKYVGVFMLAQIIHGIGFTPMFTLGTVYVDENSDSSMSAVYIGLNYAATAIGVASGFFAGGQFMQHWFVDFDRVDQDSLGFDGTSMRWVGAWWLGFVITAVAFVVVAIPIFGYPKYMPANANAIEAEKQLQKDADKSFGRLALDLVKDFFRAFLRLLMNPTYMVNAFAGCSESLIILGVSAFSFKYLAEMYSLGFDDAGLLLGGLILVGSFGMFLGGLLIRVFRLELVGMLRLNTISSLIAAALGLAYMASCPEVRLAGLQILYPTESVLDGYSAGCNTDCACDQMNFNPVCGADNVVYYSACHAGCLQAPGQPMEPYTNCSCVSQSLGIPRDVNATATPGRCDDGCTNLKILAPCLFLMMIAVLTATTPSSMATLRCVDKELQPFALGLGWMLLRLLGSIPGPVLIGSVIDSACLIWSGEQCGSSGNCLLYSKDELSLGVLLWWVITSGVTAALFFLASVLAQRLNVKGGSYDIEDKDIKL